MLYHDFECRFEIANNIKNIEPIFHNKLHPFNIIKLCQMNERKPITQTLCKFASNHPWA